ncbi:MAG TPA: zinc-finger-containing protein, partial [Candidatus Limnocylindrales bacterium]|nr:zinc-finger-containing protein [Candidatus Limnocylindrales bacterium]
AKMKRRPEAVPPVCPICRKPARLTDGAEIYPHRSDLADRPIWKCDECGAYVGCHPRSTRPLGTPANAELRAARQRVHVVLDPLWQKADRCSEYTPENDKARSLIRQVARTRIYAFLADRLKLNQRSCHTAEFTFDQCERAISYLRGTDYPTIRDWYKAQKGANGTPNLPGSTAAPYSEKELPI